jgi:hypothetical protein
MQELEARLAKARFARRHLSKMAGVGLAALIARVAMPKPARAQDQDEAPGEDEGVTCFLKGTKVRTITGERAVEDLAIGDLVVTPHGPRLITAISHFVIAKPWPRAAIPVRIARSALAPEVPHTDLYVSQGHAVMVDDLLLMAQGLVNGRTITYADDRAELEYFNIKLESHDVIYAAGALCESEAADVTELCAPIAFRGRRSQIASHWRSALSPWIDRRTPVDVARDRLEERASCF